jgi:pimeloyl-ACP methyl ester carboxylesterase
VPAELGVAVLQPEGHHRAVERCSMGYEGVWRDVPAWIDAAEDIVAVDRARIYACGLSMGGQESLLMAARNPEAFAAVFAFNPVVDAAAWYEDLVRTPSAELRAEGSEARIADEVGGTPAEVPDAYAVRSVLGAPGFLDALRPVPIKFWWSHLDLVVPRQAECHGKRLYDELKRLDPDAPVGEYNHTARYALSDPPTDDERWAIHETADYRFATEWLLLHRRR